MNRRSAARRLALLLVVTVTIAPPCTLAAQPLEEVDYEAIAPHPTAIPGRIEVIEFFYYGCDACNRLEPRLQSWLKGLPGDVDFRRVPALRRTAWIPLTRLYFALEQLGEVERLHMKVYQAVHESGLNLGDSSELYPWAENAGLDRKRLAQILDSDLVSAQVERAHDSTIAYHVTATPSFVVDGRYLTSAGMTGSVEALLPVVEGLIDKARLARAQQ